ncbi:hypothetical protein HNR33_004080 [Brassicibacter mesophilus]
MKYAFIDECGNFGFDFNKSGNSSHFIITAIVVDKDSVQELRKSIDNIRRKYFQNGEIKSSKVSRNNHARRFQILNDIVKYDFRIISLVVDKRKIKSDTSGLRFKKPFIKYLHNLLYKELRLVYPCLEIYADEHGSENFMKEFANYVYKTKNLMLFDTFFFKYVNSKEEPLVQLADFIGGTISYGFENDKICKEYRGFYRLIENKINVIRQWPIIYENYIKNLDVIDSSKYDRKIAEYCIRAAAKYIKEHESSVDNTELDRVYVLNYLLNQIYVYNPSKYIYSKELRDYLRRVRNSEYENHTFRTNIIANLRDNDVIISSSSNGYKIPVSEKELYSYTNITLGQVMPMLERLDKARKRILSITDNNLDVLAGTENEKIRKYFDG